MGRAKLRGGKEERIAQSKAKKRTHELPPIEKVGSYFTGPEAFAHGSQLFARTIELEMAEETHRRLETAEYTEYPSFKLAMQVQLGGLSLLGTKELDSTTWLPVPLACFAVDHLLWGFMAAMNGHVRVAFTLVRGAVEASIFEAAASLQPEKFRKKWNTRQGTGGAVLSELTGLPPRVHALLQVAWDLTVELGHASHIPVMTSFGTATDKGQMVKTLTFAGQYAGPLDAELLDQIVRVYCLSAFAACEAMNVALRPHMRDSTYWSSQYQDLLQKFHSPTSMPASWKTEKGIALVNKLRGDT